MPSLFPALSSLGFFYSSFILHQLWVPLQPPETRQKERTLSSLPPTQKNLRHHMNPAACPSQLFFSSASATAVAPTPGLCVPHHRQFSWHRRRHFTRRKEHAEAPRLQLTPSHTPPWQPPTCSQNLALCWPVSPSEGATFTTKPQQHCPQMCREQTPRGPPCVSSKLLLGCWELASRTLSNAFWVRAQKVWAVWHNRATMYCLESLQKHSTGVPTAALQYDPSGAEAAQQRTILDLKPMNGLL